MKSRGRIVLLKKYHAVLKVNILVPYRIAVKRIG